MLSYDTPLNLIICRIDSLTSPSFIIVHYLNPPSVAALTYTVRKCMAVHCLTLPYTASHRLTSLVLFIFFESAQTDVNCRMRPCAASPLAYIATHCLAQSHTALHCFTLAHAGSNWLLLPQTASAMRSLGRLFPFSSAGQMAPSANLIFQQDAAKSNL